MLSSNESHMPTGDVVGMCQRKMLEWWFHSKTQLPDDPLQIARQRTFGQDQLAKVSNLVLEDLNKADPRTSRPAFYDNAIPTEYPHSIGIRKVTPANAKCPISDTPTGHTSCYLARFFGDHRKFSVHLSIKKGRPGLCIVLNSLTTQYLGDLHTHSVGNHRSAFK